MCACVYEGDMYILNCDTGRSPQQPRGLYFFLERTLDLYVLLTIDFQSGCLPVRALPSLFNTSPVLVLRQGRHTSWLPNSPRRGRRATAAVAATTRVNYSLSWRCVHTIWAHSHQRSPSFSLCRFSNLRQSFQFAISYLVKAEERVESLGSKFLKVIEVFR